MSEAERIVVLGLGYVGLPLAVALARKFDVTGFDIDVQRIEGLKAGFDRTGVVAADALAESTIKLTGDPADCGSADVYIVTVPTPLDRRQRARPVAAAGSDAHRRAGDGQRASSDHRL